jgi:drug/metabolite transporter (DMT)-like permease
MNLLLLLLNGSLIAGIYAFAKMAAQAGVSPFGLLAWQLLSAALGITAVAAALGQRPVLSRATVRYALVAGTLGISAPNLVTFSALAQVPAGLIGVIGALSPVFTYALALALGVERLRGLRALGIAVGLAGVLALLLPRSAGPGDVPLGWALLALGGPLLLAGGNLFRTLAWPPGLPPLAAASLMLVLQAVVVVPAALALGEFHAPGPGLEPADRALLGSGVLTTVFYLTAFELQKRAGPVVVGQLGYVITAASLLLGVLVFGERPGAGTFAAVAVVFVGVMLVHHTPAAAAPRHADAPRRGEALP